MSHLITRFCMRKGKETTLRERQREIKNEFGRRRRESNEAHMSERRDRKAPTEREREECRVKEEEIKVNP